MIKELKFLTFIIVIFLFFFFISKHYFSENYKRDRYRSINLFDKKIINYVKKLPYLKNDTNKIIEYVDDENNPKKKKY